MRVFSGEYFVVHWENANKQPAFTAKENYRTEHVGFFRTQNMGKRL